jgi:hypothetical protein
MFMFASHAKPGFSAIGLKTVLFALLVSLFSSCTTYYISPDSFRQQFAGIDSSKLKKVELRGGGLLSMDTYLANPIVKIKCVDKKGNPAELRNGPNIEIRFTYAEGDKSKRTIFFFDRVFVTDSSVIGVRMRTLGKLRSIPLKSITKIEVQNGGKNYYYKTDRVVLCRFNREGRKEGAAPMLTPSAKAFGVGRSSGASVKDTKRFNTILCVLRTQRGSAFG